MRNSEKMPVLFLGHGSPTNAITDNAFSKFLLEKGRSLPVPKAILAISAHWETRGTKVLKVERPETIHDFYGFPPELFKIQYPAPGSPQLADQVQALLQAHKVETSSSWGLDHGTWALLKFLYPRADIPVLQLSLNQNLPMKDHFELAKSLRPLREQGVLIMGSGNITHNLRYVDWGPKPKPMDWALEFDTRIAQALKNRDLHTLLAEDTSMHSLWRMAVPSLDHYLPLIYALGVSDEKDSIDFPYEEMQMGSLSMRAVEFKAS